MRRALRAVGRFLRAAAGEVDTLGFLAGAGLLVKGTAMISAPAAYIVAGVLLCGLSYMAARRRS